MTLATPTASPDEETIEVPDNAVIACPLVAFEFRKVVDCHACPKCGGLEDLYPGSKFDFGKRYRVRCFGEPVKRPVAMLHIAKPEGG